MGFAAGFLATLTLHQLGLGMLHLLGVTPAVPWVTRPVPPFGVPQVISLAFWGGVWGIVLVLVERGAARSPGGYWLGATLFGAMFPTLVAWFVVFSLKGIPAGGGFHWPGILVGPIVNALWGLGTALFLVLDRPASSAGPVAAIIPPVTRGRRRRPSPAAPGRRAPRPS